MQYTFYVLAIQVEIGFYWGGGVGELVKDYSFP